LLEKIRVEVITHEARSREHIRVIKYEMVHIDLGVIEVITDIIVITSRESEG
jgi:hypothetical protein